VFDGELVDWSAKDVLDARQPDDGHRVSVWNREPGPRSSMVTGGPSSRQLGAGSTPAAALVEVWQQKRDRQDHAEGQRCHDGQELGHDGSLITAGERVEG
jgi:hypothetical protein